MACDRQFTHSSGVAFKGKTKIIDLKKDVAKAIFGADKAFIGFCGNADVWGEIVSWYDSPSDKPPKTKGIELLLLTSNKKIYHATNLANWMEIDEPFFSIGSGMHLALGAMSDGASPKEAVVIASKHDLSTGMGVKEYTL